jgi:hypothetical protein
MTHQSDAVGMGFVGISGATYLINCFFAGGQLKIPGSQEMQSVEV